MKSAGCTLKLLEDRNDPHTHRTCELSIREGRSWALTRSSSDPRLALATGAGSWAVNEESAGSGRWVLYLFDAESLVILLELHGLAPDFLDRVGCGRGLSGTGWRQGPPSSDVVYDLWWGCV
jgi:hypothetical protein